MILNDIISSKNYYFSLKQDLKESYQIDMDYFESLTVDHIKILEQSSNRIIEEVKNVSLTLIDYQNKSPILKLNEALRIYLKEIYPQKKVKFKENLEYTIDPNNGATISGDGDERPDLYWREDQYKLEKALAARLQNPESTPEDYIKYDPRDEHPIDAPSNKNNIYVSVLNPDKINGLDGEVLQINTNPNEKNDNSIEMDNTSKPDNLESALKASGININFYIGNLKEGEMNKITKLAELTENVILQEAELQRAEIVLATKDIVSRLQKQIEDIAGMATDDVLPLVDGMKENFGSPTANSFAQKAESALQTASDSVQALRDLFDSYARALEKHISDGSVPNDMSLGDEVAVEPEAEPEAAPEPEDYEKKTPEEALMGEGKDSKLNNLNESQKAAIKFAKEYNKSPMPLYLLSESEKRQLKLASKILKGL